MQDGTVSGYAELWVCFELPATPPARDVLVLSFLPPGQEDAALAERGPQLVSGRAVLQEVRSGARRAYLDLVARLGATPCLGGRTLRQALVGRGGFSRWWLLKTSEKDCVWDGDQTYSALLRLFAVRAVADKHGLTRIRVHGGEPGFAAALGADVPGPRARGAGLVAAVAFGLASRAVFFASRLRRWWICRRASDRLRRADVLLEAHWDWSLGPDGRGGLRERYFADLPGRLASRGVAVAWLAASEPDAEVWQRGRSLRSVLGAAADHPDVVLLDSHTTLADIARSAFDLRYPLVVTRALGNAEFRRLFQVDGVDLFPLMRRPVLVLAWGPSPAHWELLAFATERACARLRPRMLLTFLELFLHSKALYAGARRGAPGVRIWSAQHAAYCSDKTFGAVNVAVEREGRPDGCATPAPDGVFVMGELARRLWRANGYSEDEVVVTGGLRYQRIAIEPGPPRAAVAGRASLLLIGGMNTAADLDMCDAMAAAARGLDGVEIRLRDHPQYCLSEKPGFARFRGRIDVTTGTADEDLAQADAVLFTHSAFAEEALLRGIPTWQWLWSGFNTSVFLDLPVIPTFTSVAALRAALQSFLADPAAHRPSRETQEYVLRQCFGPDAARASERIADRIAELVGESA